MPTLAPKLVSTYLVLFVRPSVRPSICPSVYLSVRLSVCLSTIDESASKSLNKSIVWECAQAKLVKQLESYVSYYAPMSAIELEGYECITTNVTDACPCITNSTPCKSTCITSAWWGNYSGPCCRPKPAAK